MRKYGQDAFPPFGWSGVMSPPFMVFLVLMLVVGLLLPEDGVRANAVASAASSAVRQGLLRITPLADINAHARTTAFPAVALLNHALLWLGIATLLIYNTAANAINWRAWQAWLDATHDHVPPLKLGQHPIGFLMLIAAPAIFSLIPGGTTFAGEADLRSRVFFTLLGVGTLFLWQVFTYGFAPRYAYFRRRERQRAAALTEPRTPPASRSPR